MFHDDRIAGSWTELTRRLDGGLLRSWADAEPALAGLDTAALVAATARRADPRRCDELLGALVRRAAQRDDDGSSSSSSRLSADAEAGDATLLVVHLLSDGLRALTRRLRDLSGEIVTLAVGELALQVRTFPWRRRTRAYAANLLMDTEAALLRELLPGRTRAHPAGRDIELVDPLNTAAVLAVLDASVPGPGDAEGLDLVDLLVWAARTGVAPAQDLELLWELHRDVRHGAGSSRLRAAARRGVNEQTVRRHRDRTLRALQDASGDYLRAVA